MPWRDNFFSTDLKYAFEIELLAKFSGFGIEVGAIWDSIGPLLGDFGGVFSRVDFFMVLGPKWGGVGGMCGVPLGLRFCRFL